MTEAVSRTPSDIQSAILEFIHSELVAGDVTVQAGDDLLSGELLDSLAILRLATHVDELFKIGMKPTDFLIENFQNVDVLTDFVLRAQTENAR